MKSFLGIAIVFSLLQTVAYAQVKLSGDEFSTRIDSSKNVQLIDVRTAEEFGAGHLPGAKNIDFKKEDFLEKIAQLNKEEPVMVYCLAGGRSASAAQLLVENGFSNVYDLEGGYMRWTVEKRPVAGVKETPKAALVGMPVSDYNDMLKTDLPVLVDFTAKWCAPCKAMYPTIKKIESEFDGKALVKIIDIDVNKTVTEHLGIKYLPLLYLYKNGQIVWQSTGVVNEKTLREVITQQL